MKTDLVGPWSIIFWRSLTLGAVVLTVLVACQPTVKVEAPKDPIVINLNVKIEHEVLVKVDKELDTLFGEDPELF